MLAGTTCHSRSVAVNDASRTTAVIAVLVKSSGLSAGAGASVGNAEDNTRSGVFAAVFCFLGAFWRKWAQRICCRWARCDARGAATPAYSAVQGPETVLVRPHPAVWRLWHGVSVTYMLFLVFLLFQTPSGARELMRVRASVRARCVRRQRASRLTSALETGHIAVAGQSTDGARVWRRLPAAVQEYTVCALWVGCWSAVYLSGSGLPR